MVTLDAIRGPVAQELEEFDAFVRRNFKVENELLSGMVDYILSSRGKGVRPLLVLLSAALNAPAGGRGIGQRTYLAAMLVEIIHTASLIHDDVIDEADTRRGRASANAKWQSRNAVVLGDYLLARNMELGMRSGQYDLVSYVIASIATLCEGELLQSDRAERMEITRDAYLEIIYKKTASLLGISAGVGALSAGANREQVARMRRFGDALGMAFQIQDDILDFTRGAETASRRTTTCANTRSRCRCCYCSTVPTRRGATSCSPCWHAAARTKRRSTPCNRPSRSREACRRRRK